MGGASSRNDFYWSYDDEPHATRRRQILEKHPEIKKLMRVDHSFKYQVAAVITLQLFVTALTPMMSWPVLILVTYIVGATINHALLVAVHETVHNNAFGHGKLWLNRIHGLLYNLPIGFPFATTFKRYHLDHHKYQGDEIMDTDVPTEWEGRVFANTATKLFFVIFQFAFYALRPIFVREHKVTGMDIVSAVMQIVFDAVIWYLFGWKAIFYLLAGSMLGMGPHPTAGHFISDHYMFDDGFETYSYYGCLNYVTFNYGHHNEHHDFPNVPCSLLPKIREMAPEFYNTVPYHTSWVKVLYDYITDPSIGPYARVKRKTYTRNNVIKSSKDGKFSTEIDKFD